MREMKECGIQWIPEIPSNWKVLRGKSILRLLKRSPESYTEVITCFRDGEVTLRKNRREEGFTFSDKEIGYQGICNGDLVIHGMDGFAGAIGISDSDGKGSPVLVVCDSNENKKYLVYYLRMLATQNVFVAMATGIRERSCDLRWNKIADLLFPIPPVSEQNKIVDYLDEKCAKIDAVIEKQKQVIEKLKEYKLSVITEAVTKGLDPTVPMKDSGVEWIGDIPYEAETIKLKYILTVSSGDAIDTIKFSENGIYPVFGGGELIGYCNDYNTEENNILIGRVGARCGCITLTKQKSWATDNALIVSSFCEAKYLYYLLVSVNLNKLNTANAQPLITGTKVKNCTVVYFDNEKTQQDIVLFLDEKCSEIDSAIVKKQAIVEKLTEYKKSLIYEVVTGKREV